MGSALLLLLSLGLAHADCPDVQASTAAAVDALVAARLEEAEAALARAELGFSCGSPPSAEVLARFWLAEAAASSVAGDADDAVDAWQAAARLAPALWEPRYGPDLRKRRDAAVLSTLRREASVRADPLPERYTLLLDGEKAPNPTPATEGLHLVQVAQRDVLYGKIVLLAADENMLVRPELPAVEASTEAPRQGPRIGLIAGGGLGIAAGAGLLVVAARQDPHLDEIAADWRAGALSTADASDDLSARWTLARATGGAGVALTALGLAGIGVGFVW